MISTSWTEKDLGDLHGRTVIITGANSGIGRAAVVALARAGAHVTLAVRDVNKGAAVAATMNGEHDVRALDLSDLASVRSFATDTSGPIDILINNAGVMATPFKHTVDGFELQIGTNHLGHFALTNLLVPKITGRVVVVSSDLHRSGRIDLDDLNWERRKYRPMSAYSQSKLANLLFVLELQRRFIDAGSSVRAIGAHPGYAATNLQSGTDSAAMKFLGAIGNRLIAQSDAMGALPTLYAAVADVVGGAFIGPDGFRHMRGYPSLNTPSPRARDASTARALWDLSEKLTGTSWPLAGG